MAGIPVVPRGVTSTPDSTGKSGGPAAGVGLKAMTDGAGATPSHRSDGMDGGGASRTSSGAMAGSALTGAAAERLSEMRAEIASLKASIDDTKKRLQNGGFGSVTSEAGKGRRALCAGLVKRKSLIGHFNKVRGEDGGGGRCGTCV